MFLTYDKILTKLILENAPFEEIHKRAREIRSEFPNRNCNFECWVVFTNDEERDTNVDYTTADEWNKKREELIKWETEGSGYLTTHEEHGLGMPPFHWNGQHLTIGNNLPIFYKQISGNEYKPIYKNS